MYKQNKCDCKTCKKSIREMEEFDGNLIPTLQLEFSEKTDEERFNFLEPKIQWDKRSASREPDHGYRYSGDMNDVSSDFDDDPYGVKQSERRYRYPRDVKYRIRHPTGRGYLEFCIWGFIYILGQGVEKIRSYTAMVTKTF